MAYACPHCSVVAKRAASLRTHLTGAIGRGGHALLRADADDLIAGLEGGELDGARPTESRSARARSEAAWRRELRCRQVRWREERGYPIGLHKGQPSGSRLAMPQAKDELWNFLTPAIGALVRDEFDANRRRDRIAKKLYGYPRLFDNLLSSQPLVFNLFGELASNLSHATKVGRRLWPRHVDGVTRIEFEWSPGRGDAHYLGNRTAADVALFHTTPEGGKGVIFVETKYHEDLSGKDNEIRARCIEVAQASGAFLPGAEAVLRSGRLQQIWLDHLLALAIRQRDRLDSALFVLLYPELNIRCRDAAAIYATLLEPAIPPAFEARTLETALSAIASVIDDAWVGAFWTRYLRETTTR